MIKILSLVENTSSSPELKSKHGLSLYIETPRHKILFDLGSNALFLENAQKLGIENSLRDRQQITFTTDHYVIDDELMLFSNVTGRKLYSKANDKLFAKRNGKIVPDKFDHEQYLVITDGDKQIMITGCSHNGIVNIIQKYTEINKGSMDKLACVLGGFHLFNPITRKYENDELISDVAEYLCGLNVRFYTCHCTGQKAYKILKDGMGGQIDYLSTGMKVEC